jgi:hypothetical protein
MDTYARVFVHAYLCMDIHLWLVLSVVTVKIFSKLSKWMEKNQVKQNFFNPEVCMTFKSSYVSFLFLILVY